ncbi:maleylpyruvate isomerase N-terminal domain-containing protein [Actinomadura miaoliensis]|uniref:Mycothiol-dependent maleylpyruvate isomerase metal-binding domain-containing protein n=1 Tax=Actinomadura miaoliensis TaxID=430685 RepID=A0ABP7WN74_9ACTN
MTVRDDFLDTAAAAVRLLEDAAVAERWDDPSALEGMTVGALAAHLAHQIFLVPRLLDAGGAENAEPVSLIDHYSGPEWDDADVHAALRRSSAEAAEQGARTLAERAAATLADLRGRLPSEPADRVVPLPWAQPLTLDDLLTTRMMELVVHSDDLAVSVDKEAAPPPAAVETVIGLLARLSARRHGPTAVLRALSRAERAPASISAF